MRIILFALLTAAFVVPASAQIAGRDPMAVFDQADTDHDGRVSRDDFARLLKIRPQAGARIDALIAEADANHDGKVTRAELAAAPTALFDRADTNHDGFVDKAELEAARVKLRQFRQER